jgi:RHS repeat-associated protein
VLTLPNGVTVEYGYDAASQITGLTYKLGSTTLGDLTYSYDLAGNRTSVGGSWARTGLPTALASVSYDAANQIATWGSTSFGYDANGNLTNDGAKTYTWNARNQLTSLSGGVSASFQYDGLGRRRAKTVSGTGTGFLYDGLNVVQELTSGSPSANIVPGLVIDEWLVRTDSSGARHFLTDALGSTVALTNSSGSVVTEYTSHPFGETTTSGSSSTNPFQFTGRESDGTGLMFYRARYFAPTLQRFTAEDPIEFTGGFNIHVYVENNPVSHWDPLGLQLLPRVITWLPRNVAGRVTRPVTRGPAPKIRPGNWTEPPPGEILKPRTPMRSPDFWDKIGDIIEELIKGVNPDDLPTVPPVHPLCEISGRKCDQPPPPCYLKGLCDLT